MDQHPIPQDVTGFQFKLIGTMTVKQFGYVASGVILAVVFYYLPLNSTLGILLKVLLVPLFGICGVVVAFVPIDGRPIDIMTTNFAKALFSPNQYIYHRQGRILSFEAISVAKVPVKKKTKDKTEQQIHTMTDSRTLSEKEKKLQAFLMSSQGQTKNEVDKKEAAFLKALTIPEAAPATAHGVSPVSGAKPLSPLPARPTFAAARVTPAPLPVALKTPAHPVAVAPQQQPQIAPLQPQAPANPLIPPNGTKQNEELVKKETELEQALSQAKQEESISKTPATHSAAEQKVTQLSQQIQEIHAQKQQLEVELSHLQNQLATQKNPAVIPPHPVPVQPQQIPTSQYAKVIPQPVNKRADVPRVSDTPNVVVGIVKDPRGNILPNILVEVKDKDGNPVRAFKTNQLGQFASATPLSPGTYTIELEDPKKLHRFDAIQVAANNQVLMPIEVVSHDEREDLRKQLFAN